MEIRPTRWTALKIEQLSLLATLVLAFAALAALVLTGQAGLREDLRAFQADTLTGQAGLREDLRAGQAELREEIRAGQAELRAGQVQLREDLAALGVRLAVVEFRTDALESRFAATEQHSTEPCEAVDCPGS